VFLDWPVWFRGEDRETQGSWAGVYGASGVWLPPGAGGVVVEGSPYVWTPATTDPRALASADGRGRFAPCWWSASRIRLTVDVPELGEHEMALYFLDWDRSGRRERVTVRRAGGGIEDVREVRDFGEGIYLRWQLRGPVVVEIENLPGSPNAVVSGVFLEPAR